MIRCALLVIGLMRGLTAGVALADPPKFSQGGFLLTAMYGPGFWSFDRALLGSQVGDGNVGVFLADIVNTHTIALRAGYNILGHASVGADFTATGWRIDTPDRGGGGVLTGYVAWHPLELVFMKKEQRPIGLDVSTMFGVGYGIMGQRRGMDGVVLQWGLNADYFLARYFAVGLFAKGSFLLWDKFYIDYYGRDQPGNTIQLTRGSGGSFWTLGIAITFRAGE
jgi:hypothetical protein